MPLVGPCNGGPRIPDLRAMLRCIASTRSASAAVESIARRLTPRISEGLIGLVLVMATPRCIAALRRVYSTRRFLARWTELAEFAYSQRSAAAGSRSAERRVGEEC